jgi:hypothetical protein
VALVVMRPLSLAAHPRGVSLAFVGIMVT